jgi:hypothetical protein
MSAPPPPPQPQQQQQQKPSAAPNVDHDDDDDLCVDADAVKSYFIEATPFDTPGRCQSYKTFFSLITIRGK